MIYTLFKFYQWEAIFGWPISVKIGTFSEGIQGAGSGKRTLCCRSPWPPEFSADLGLTKEGCKIEILGLSVTDYCQGPQPDHDRPGDIWVFGREIADRDVYIKLKIAEVGSDKIAKCISFHAAEHPLCYPYKQQEQGR